MHLKLLIIFLVLSSSLFAQEIEILVDGQLVKKYSIEDVKKMKSENVEFYNHVTKRAETYKGVPFYTFIEQSVPETQSESMVEIEFNTINEFNTFFPKELFDKANAILSYERADGDTFTRYSQKRKMLISVGPLYLVWDLKNVPKDEKINFTSIYQINKINIVTNKKDFGITENSIDKNIYLGLQAYKKNCISCHAIGKFGGGVSFDLVKRRTLEVKGSDYIKKYIVKPSSINPKTQMLPLPKYKNQPEVVDGIIEFLKFMQNPDEVLKKNQHDQGNTSYKALKEVVDQSVK